MRFTAIEQRLRRGWVGVLAAKMEYQYESVDPAGFRERRRQTPEQVVTTWITAGELFYGAAKSRDPAGNKVLVERFLDTLPVLLPDSIAAQFFGALKALLEAEGRRLADADLWIGASARAHRATVVTGNTRHFGRMAGVEVEDWMRD